MDIAQCTTNGISYDIASFSELDKPSLDKLRRTLICKECAGKGYYRKKSRDGKPACFGAYHEDECSYKSKNSQPKYDAKTTEEVNRIITNNDTVDVEFNAYTAKQLKTTAQNNTPSNSNLTSASSTQHTGETGFTRNTTKGLRALLRMLMHTDSFASSNINIQTDAEHPFKAKNIFVNFDEINEEHIGKWRGYWGIISHADSNIEWLNTANKNDVSIPIGELKDYISTVFNIVSNEDLAGAAVLVFGRLSISKSDKKKWFIRIKPNEPGRIFIKLN